MTPKQYAEYVAGEVRAEMGKQRKTQAELAEVLQMTAPTASRRLGGEIAFDVFELVLVAEWLGCDVHRFTGAEQAQGSAA